MEKQTVAVDIDDVLAEFLLSLVDHYNVNYVDQIKYTDFTSYGFEKVWGGTLDEAIAKVKIFYHTTEFLEIEPVKGAVDSIKSLSQKYNLIVVTSRPDSIEDKTIAWLDRHFPHMFSQIISTNHFVADKKVKKSDVCLQHNAKIIIEDSMDHAKDCVSQGIKVVLFNRPWNQDQAPDDVYRVHDWNQIVSKINELLK